MSISQQVEHERMKQRMTVLEDAILKLRNDLTHLQIEKAICQVEQRQIEKDKKKTAMGVQKKIDAVLKKKPNWQS